MRSCGDCQLCCTLLPVRDFKLAMVKCRYQRFGKGCTIYPSRPTDCRLWSCMWLADNVPVRRPDRSHYVIDMISTTVASRNDETGGVQHLAVVQIWCDPRYPDAHRDPQLRAWLLTTPPRGFALVRYNESDGLVLWPPHSNPSGQWYEMLGTNTKQLPEQTDATDHGRQGSLQADDPAGAL